MTAKSVETLSTLAHAESLTLMKPMTEAEKTSNCNNCGHPIDKANQPWTYMKEGLRTVFYHYDAAGCQESSDKAPTLIRVDRRTKRVDRAK